MPNTFPGPWRRCVLRALVAALLTAAAGDCLAASEGGGDAWVSVLGIMGLSTNEGFLSTASATLHLGSHLGLEGYAVSSANVQETFNGQGARLILLPGKTFYLAGGMERRTIYYSGEGPLVATEQGDQQYHDDVVKDYGSTFGLGNWWKWRHFSLRAEWLQVYVRTKRYYALERTYTKPDGTNWQQTSQQTWTGQDDLSSSVRMQLGLGVAF